MEDHMAGHKYTQLSPFSSADKDRFRALIATEDAGGCWIWTGKKDAKGYGYFFRQEQAISSPPRILFHAL